MCEIDRRLIVGLAAIVIIAAPPVLFILFGDPGLLGASVVTTGLLTLALVVLYFQQYTVLDRQTELMKRDYESSIAVAGQITAEDDYVYMDLKNAGRGAIRYMYLKSEVISDTGPVSLEPGHYQLRAVEDGETSLPGFGGPREFKGRVKIVYQSDEHDEKRSFPFKFITDPLAKAGIEECTIRLTLQIVDEITQDEEDITEFEIAEQELELVGKQEKEIETEEGDTEVREIVVSTPLSEGITPRRPQDIVPRDSLI